MVQPALISAAFSEVLDRYVSFINTQLDSYLSAVMLTCHVCFSSAAAETVEDYGLGRLKATVRYSAQRNKLVLVVANCV